MTTEKNEIIPIIYIGLGGTGSRVVKVIDDLLKQVYDEEEYNVKSDFFQTIAFDTVDNPDQGCLESMVCLTKNNPIMINEVVPLFKERCPEKFEWWPKEYFPVHDLTGGAGRMRLVGRFAVFQDLLRGQDSKIITTLKNSENKIQRIREDTDNISVKDPLIFLIHSFSGGSGAGMVWDISYLVKNIFNSNSIYRVVLMPGIISLTSPNDNNKKKEFDENFTATFQELLYYSIQFKTPGIDREYSLEYNSDKKIIYEEKADGTFEPPQQFTILFDERNQNNNKLDNYEDYIKLIGDILFKFCDKNTSSQFIADFNNMKGKLTEEIAEKKGKINKKNIKMLFKNLGSIASGRIEFPLEDISIYIADKEINDFLSTQMNESISRDDFSQDASNLLKSLKELSHLDSRVFFKEHITAKNLKLAKKVNKDFFINIIKASDKLNEHINDIRNSINSSEAEFKNIINDTQLKIKNKIQEIIENNKISIIELEKIIVTLRNLANDRKDQIKSSDEKIQKIESYKDGSALKNLYIEVIKDINSKIFGKRRRIQVGLGKINDLQEEIINALKENYLELWDRELSIFFTNEKSKIWDKCIKRWKDILKKNVSRNITQVEDNKTVVREFKKTNILAKFVLSKPDTAIKYIKISDELKNQIKNRILGHSIELVKRSIDPVETDINDNYIEEDVEKIRSEIAQIIFNHYKKISVFDAIEAEIKIEQQRKDKSFKSLYEDYIKTYKENLAVPFLQIDQNKKNTQKQNTYPISLELVNSDAYKEFQRKNSWFNLKFSHIENPRIYEIFKVEIGYTIDSVKSLDSFEIGKILDSYIFYTDCRLPKKIHQIFWTHDIEQDKAEKSIVFFYQGLKYGYIKMSEKNMQFYFGHNHIGKGLKNAIQNLRNNAKLLKELEKKINQEKNNHLINDWNKEIQTLPDYVGEELAELIKDKKSIEILSKHSKKIQNNLKI